MKDNELRTALGELRTALADLAARVERLEGSAAVPAAAPPAAALPAREAPPAASAPPAAPRVEEIPEHIVLALSAAVAAFLGERAHIRTIRLIRSAAWAQQGRVSIQASHRLRR